ncbi:tetraacyldisaccharide 4'-kinase [Pedobacter sp. MC2016-14]|uniref:tetraacyldisaccharide 4'-kinase n=1 Tax=Pedobacter sp. MC2016-14 TaxID=2897327 RepID=UPI001E4FE4B1|nr:tetraacyldisaccharide 4'-kinase [Pedobacter sp. MC2016-14]MCD0488035.1 tetraacyldisaccharide 4'-kinase [Pedobacter sp. MC2016-14]
MFTYLRLLLFPFSLIYGLVVIVRNKLYDAGFFKSVAFDLPVICVGNLVVGGSGKTPVTEYLVSLLSTHKIAILSRGYGRNTKGFILADESATAQSIGDEPMQFFSKFPQVTVAVCEDRVYGIAQLQQQHDLIILDDAFQHRAVKAGFNILLFEYQKLRSFQFLLPAGNLREPFSGFKRAQAVLVTKAPANLSPADEALCSAKFRTGKNKPSFSFLKYDDLISLNGQPSKPVANVNQHTVVFLLTGIANPGPLISYISNYTKAIEQHEYPDHYQFSLADIDKLCKAFKQHPGTEKIIITTEKDAQRLLSSAIQELLLNLPVYYLPVKVALKAEDKITFDKKILDYVSSHTRNRTIHKAENS